MEFLKTILGDSYAEFESKINAYNESHSDKPVKLVNLADGNYVDKEKYNSLRAESDGYKQQISDRDKQLKELKNSAAGNEELTARIEQLQAENKSAKEKYEKELSDIRFNNAVDFEIAQSGTRNVKALKALIDMDNIKQDGDKITGLSEQLEALKNEHDYLFAAEQRSTGLEQNVPGTDMDGVERRFYERNPDLKN